MSVRVLMVGPEGVGGIASLLQTLVPAVKQQVDLLFLPTVLGRPLKDAGKVSAQNLGLAVSQYARFAAALHRFHPDIVHIHTSQGLGWLKDSLFVLMAKAYRRRVVLHVHAAEFSELYGSNSRLVRAYTRRVMRLADAVIAVSTEWKTFLADIVPAERIHAFRPCIAAQAAVRSPLSSASDGVKGLFLGSVGTRKGVFDLLEAMSAAKSFGSALEVRIAGPEERSGDLARVQARLAELHLQDVCRLVGVVQGEEKERLLSESNLFVLPSYNEGLPMAIVEAMASGLAVISTPVGGIPEIVKDGYNGYLVQPGDVSALAERLGTLAGDPALREVMGQRSREIVEQELDIKPYVARLVALYGALAGPGAERV